LTLELVILEEAVATIEIYGIETGLIAPGDDVLDAILGAMGELGLEFRDGDVLAVATKAISMAMGALVELGDVEPSDEARELAEATSLEPEFVEVVLREADEVYGGVERALLTVKSGIMAVNAGVDHKNVGIGRAALWPPDPQAVADGIRMGALERTGRRIGVVLVDSRITPLRRGTIGLAVATSGFEPVEDCRGRRDIYGRPLRITWMALADDLACAAHLAMGETDRLIPAALIRGAPIRLGESADRGSAKIPPEDCVFMRALGIRGPGPRPGRL
jgi:coenzyme F420-0:L-glutamate ligase/coenzyme F420-1:gamma-L-glutamate ligase